MRHWRDKINACKFPVLQKVSRMKQFSCVAVGRGRLVFGLFLFTLIAMNRPAPAQNRIYFFDDSPPPATQPSLGQQLFPPQIEPDLTPSQSNSNQLNQLFQFETTPNICAKGEGYLTTDFTYLKYPGSTKQYRYEMQGQYGFTDQIAIGGYVPGITTTDNGTESGLGDIGIYGQYKFDKLINPEIVDVTGQVDVILPTGNNSQMRDTGKFGVRPLILAYKDFGQEGPGSLGLYGLFGFTVTSNSDVRVGVAATYQINNVVGIMEFFDQTGVKNRTPLVQITPGISIRGLSPWEVSLGVPIGINSGTPDWGVIVKLTYVFQN